MTFPEILATYITIDDDIRSFLNTQTEKISVKKGTVISDQNTLNRKVYFVEKGLLRSFYFEKGKDITTNFYPENSILANIDTILRKFRRGIPLKLWKTVRLSFSVTRKWKNSAKLRSP